MILAIDTSQSSGSIAIADKDILKYSAYFDISITHSETLMPQIDYALQFCKYTPADLESIALCIGPGSFTGLRIGLATAKGISFGMGIPLICYNSLEMVAAGVYGCGRPIVSVIDAKMKEIYWGSFDQDLSVLSAPAINTLQEVAIAIPEGAMIIGSAAPQLSELLDRIGTKHRLALEYQSLPSAVNLLSLMRLHPQAADYDFEAVAELEPLYLRESTAQIKKKNMENPSAD